MIHPEYSINPGTPEDPPHVQTANDVAKNDPPPSYESLFGKIKRAKAESSGRVDFAKRSCSICTESVVFAVILCIILIIPVSMIVMGSVFLYDCRANEMVPVYLVVHGVFLIIAIIFGLLQTRSDKDKKKDSKKKKTPNEKCIELISTLIHVFLIAWFFYGNSITIGLNWVSSPATARTYCHPSLYYYAYWVIMSVYIFIGIVVFVSLCVVLYSCISGSKAKNNC
uniref:Uncharacterized protein n=1 Tax=Magallana gigas TaxID=29159 RepID=A0A8W8LAF3_MAGGI